jgi:hypothetical protein
MTGHAHAAVGGVQMASSKAASPSGGISSASPPMDDGAAHTLRRDNTTHNHTD